MLANTYISTILLAQFWHPRGIRLPQVTNIPLRLPHSLKFDFMCLNVHMFSTIEHFASVLGRLQVKTPSEYASTNVQHGVGV